MQTIRKSFWAVLPFIAACTGVEVKTNYDASTNFSHYKTYFWATTPTTKNPIMADQIVAEIDAQLYAKGWRKTKEGNADAAIAAHVTMEKYEKGTNNLYDNIEPSGLYNSAGQGAWTSSTDMSASSVSYDTGGPLIVEIFDAKTKKEIWQGTAKGTATSDDPENVKEVNEAIQKMFLAFPPSRTGGAPPR